MKAIRIRAFGGAEELRLEEVPDPHPGPDQLVVAMRAIGVNPVDTYIRSGTHAVKPPLPYTPGSDGAGVVLEKGAAVQRFAVGDRVYVAETLQGSYAERALCLEPHLHPLPASVSFAQGAAIGVPYGTAYRALFQIAAAKPGETVLVHGASGGVGLAAVQLARAAGLTVWGTAGTEAGLELVRAQGAHAVFTHGQADFARQVMESSRGHGVEADPRDACESQLGDRSGAARASRPDRRHRQPRHDRNQPARSDDTRRDDPRHDVVQFHCRRAAPACTRPSKPGSRTAPCGR
jgi:NADPH2:quinone reductase